MPKKAPKNGYFYYMLEEKKKRERNGERINGGMEQMANICSEGWKALSAEKKSEYNHIAKNNKSNSGGGEKFSSQGVPLSLIDKQKESQAECELFKEKKIQDMVELTKDIKQQTFFFVSCNYFCKLLDGTYIPAEIAILKYNLQDGIIDTYNKAFKPLKLPLGMMYTATSYSNDTHKLPVPPKAIGESDYSIILQEIVDFVYDHEKQEIPPLITNEENVRIVESILRELAFDCGYDENTFLILSLTKLFLSLKNKTARLGLNTEGFSSVHMAHTFLEMDLYESQVGKACEYHEEIDCSKFCTLSIVQRWSHTISDHCCTDLKILMVKGSHLPTNATNTIEKPYCYINESENDDKASYRTESVVSYPPSGTSFLTQPMKDLIISKPSTNPTSDFPSLCEAIDGRNRGTITPNTSIISVPRSTDNPWLRNADVRKPCNDTLDLLSLSEGRGRGALLSKARLGNADVPSNNTVDFPSLSEGRGRERNTCWVIGRLTVQLPNKCLFSNLDNG